MGRGGLPARSNGRAAILAAAVLALVHATALAQDVSAAPAGPGSAESRPLGTARARTPAPETRPADGPGTGSSVLRTVMSLGSVVALLVGGAWVVKRLARSSGSLLAAAGPGGKAPSGILEVLGRYPISRGTTLILLRVDRRVLVVAHSTGGARGGAAATTLCELTSPDDVASILTKVRDHDGESLARRFTETLGVAERAAGAALAGATTDRSPGPGPVSARRRQQVSPAGDRLELWDIPSRQQKPAPAPPAVPTRPQARTAPRQPDAQTLDGPSLDAAAETLRRRLAALGSRRPGPEGAGA